MLLHRTTVRLSDDTTADTPGENPGSRYQLAFDFIDEVGTRFL